SASARRGSLHRPPCSCRPCAARSSAAPRSTSRFATSRPGPSRASSALRFCAYRILVERSLLRSRKARPAPTPGLFLLAVCGEDVGRAALDEPIRDQPPRPKPSKLGSTVPCTPHPVERSLLRSRKARFAPTPCLFLPAVCGEDVGRAALDEPIRDQPPQRVGIVRRPRCLRAHDPPIRRIAHQAREFEAVAIRDAISRHRQRAIAAECETER